MLSFSEWLTAKNILSASMIGTLWGLACATVWNDVEFNLTSAMASVRCALICSVGLTVCSLSGG